MNIRAATHIHSNWSYDGHWPLASLSKFFHRIGYHCILTTEHDISFDETKWQSYRRACIDNSGGSFLIIPGIEYSDPQNLVHILVWGDIPFLGKGRETGDLLQDASASGGIAVLAHPSRRDAWKKYERSWADYLLGMELWNRKVDGVSPGDKALTLLKQDATLLSFAGLDFHYINQFFPIYMRIQVNGGLSEKCVIEELRKGRSVAKVAGIPVRYLSSGVLLKAASRFEQLRRYLRIKIKGVE